MFLGGLTEDAQDPAHVPRVPETTALAARVTAVAAEVAMTEEVTLGGRAVRIERGNPLETPPRPAPRRRSLTAMTKKVHLSLLVFLTLW